MPRVRRKQTVSAPTSHRSAARMSRESGGVTPGNSTRNGSGETAAIPLRQSRASVDNRVIDMLSAYADSLPAELACKTSNVQQVLAQNKTVQLATLGTALNSGACTDSAIVRELKRRALEQEPVVSADSKQIIGARYTYRAILARKNFLVCNTLGSGSYSKVKRAIHYSSSGSHIVAVKIIDRQKAPLDYQEKFLPRELNVWPSLIHPNLVRLYDWFEDNRRVYMVLEYADGGDALHYIQSCAGPVSEAMARRWVSQVSDGVAFMHRLGVAHRDLKLENVLLDQTGNAKLCDFGFVRQLHPENFSSSPSSASNGSADSSSCSSDFSSVSSESSGGLVQRCKSSTDMSECLSNTYCGSKSYAAPEILMGVPYDPRRSDVWALGVILYILVTGKMPFDETRGTKSILEEQRLLQLSWGSRRGGSGGISHSCRTLIRRMFTWDFDMRPSVQEVLQDPWFTQPEPVSAGPEQNEASRKCARNGVSTPCDQ